MIFEPGVYWKVQPSASGSFFLSFTTLCAGLGNIFHICNSWGWKPPVVNHGALWMKNRANFFWGLEQRGF